MATLLRENGVFYLSVPIGIERVEFNANRVFDPRIIVNLATQDSFKLTGWTVIEPSGIVNELEYGEKQLLKLAMQRYSLGIFVFQKYPEK